MNGGWLEGNLHHFQKRDFANRARGIEHDFRIGERGDFTLDGFTLESFKFASINDKGLSRKDYQPNAENQSKNSGRFVHHGAGFASPNRLKYISTASRYLGGRLRVSSTIALALSFSGSLPQTSASSRTRF